MGRRVPPGTQACVGASQLCAGHRQARGDHGELLRYGAGLEDGSVEELGSRVQVPARMRDRTQEQHQHVEIS